MLLRQLRRAAIVLLAAASCAAMAAGAVKNKPPTVALTSPANGATFSAPATVPLAATASDADGTVAKVEFFRGKTLIGTVTSAPYNFTWANVAAGTYSITAKATDNAGAAATSTAVSITVSTATNPPPPPPPATAITSPAAGAALPWTITDVSGTFSGPADTTVLVANGANSTVLATLTGTTTFVARNLPLVQGANTLTATAIRRDGSSSSGSVTVDVPQRLVVLTSPTRDTTYQSPPSLTFQASALLSSGSVQRIDYYEHSPFTGSVTRLGTATVPPFTFVWNSPPKGTHNVYAWLLDDKNIGRQSTEIQFTVAGPNVPPSVSLTAPANNAAFAAPASFALQASAADSDGSVSQVEFLQNGQVLASTNVAPYGFALSNLGVGAYSFAARATDDKGATTTSAQVAVNVVPNSPPTVSVTAPVNGTAFVSPGAFTLQASAADSDGTVALVEFLQNGQVIGTSRTAPYSFAVSGLAEGTYDFAVRATDDKGAATTSTPVGVSVGPNTPPSVALTTTAPDAVLPAPFSVTFDAAVTDTGLGVAKVEFYSGSNLIGTVSSAPYTFTWANVPAGTYDVTARAYNSHGASADSPPVTIRVSADAALLAAPGLADSTVNGSQVIVTGRVGAPANAGIAVNGQLIAFDRAAGRFSGAVALEPGTNTLTFVLSTEAGLTATQTITVNRAGTSTMVLTPMPAAALVGEQINYQLKLSTPVEFATAEFDLFGFGYTFSVGASSFSNGTVKFFVPGYSSPGVYRAKARLLDALGAVVAFEESIVEITAKPDLDSLARGMWTKINAALTAGDTATALVRMTPVAQVKYGPVFTALQARLPAIVAGYSSLLTGPITLSVMEYSMSRQGRGFLVYFVREADGVWRLESM